MSVFPTPQPITAALAVAGARVRLTASERTDTVVLVEPIDATSKSDVKVAENTKVGFDGGKLSIETKKAGGKNGSVAITIEVPTGSQLALNTAWSDVDADGRFGDCVLEMSSGQVRIDRAASVRGDLAAGEIAIGHVAGAVNIEGGSAGVRIGEVEGTVKYSGSTGKVWIGHARSEIELSGSSGSFDIDRADGDVVASAANCPIRVGRLSRGEAELMNASGGIEVGVDGDTATVDAKSTKGSVHNSLATAGEGGVGGVKIHARTRLDDIVIHRAA
ncbi:DUF4097 family beta strand repeat-containing protein [Amycolatopsis keratiniphila]|uniref:DUF4097 domain-containing protein n=1 Tax=Amycolatopsis keratiniphila subsp. keratiniphila TaxID=227715 RepID=A0A1W2LSF7_9PSEU|nr:DUF4097 family beta strand repeat-containing protein [Amycolatopsis keratiniphila]ONF67511.1 hypothetical protein AVR91_0222260 [Amycolatopsis keratiniphila subsp. keratiniphila]